MKSQPFSIYCEKFPLDPQTELDNAVDLLEAMKVNLRLAAEAITKYGMTIELMRLDTHQRPVIVTKTNPALKIQRDAMRVITSLRAQIPILQEQAASVANQKTQDDEWKRFERPADED